MKRIVPNLSMPLIVAPMLLVSTPALVIAACSEGVIGSVPAHGTRSTEILESGLKTMTMEFERLQARGVNAALYAVNLVVHASNPRLAADCPAAVVVWRRLESSRGLV